MPIIEMLIDTKADITAKDANNRTPLHCAARNGRVEAVRCLMEVAYHQVNEEAKNADKKVNKNAGRSRTRDKGSNTTDKDKDDLDEELRLSYLDGAILKGQR